MESVNCDLCGSNEKHFFIDQTDRFSGQVFSLMRCSSCKLIYLDPRPSQDELDKYYPENYDAFEHTNTGGGLSDLNSILPSLKRQLDFLTSFTPGYGHILDVGCATGSFMRVAQSRGWDVTGIEPNKHAYSIAKNKYKLNVIEGTLDSVKFPPGKFDVVTFWDVLEHVPSPKKSLMIVHELLKPNGIVVFSIPNLISFDRYIFKSYWIGWDAPRHFTLFDQTTTKTLLDATQFNLLGSKCVTGGKGTLYLSLDNLVRKYNKKSWFEHLYPFISLLLWPYRQISYSLKRGPIINYAAQKIKV